MEVGIGQKPSTQGIYLDLEIDRIGYIQQTQDEIPGAALRAHTYLSMAAKQYPITGFVYEAISAIRCGEGWIVVHSASFGRGAGTSLC